jgi:hypothetical protein
MTAVHPNADRPARTPRWRVAAMAGASLVLIAGAAITMAASPAPSASPNTDTGTGTQQDGDGLGPFRGRGLGGFDGFAGFAGRHGGFGAGNITITAIDGSSLSLETVDGWTRTIAVTDSTTITKDGETATLADLEVGDRIRFRQTADDDGTYSITAIGVIEPSVIGQVTAKDADSLTLQQPDGTSVTVTVDGSTEFTVGGETGKTLADVEIGMVVGAAGELNDDGTLDASRVRAGSIWQGMGRGHGRGPGFGPDLPAPSDAPEDSSSTSAG